MYEGRMLQTAETDTRTDISAGAVGLHYMIQSIFPSNIYPCISIVVLVSRCECVSGLSLK